MSWPHPPRAALVALDLVLAAGLVALSLYALTQPWDDGFRAHAGWLDVVAVIGMSAPFALRTLAPALGLGAVVVVSLAAGLVGPHTLLFYSGFVPVAVLVYAVARRNTGWPGRLAWLTPVALVAGDASEPEARAISNIVFTSIIMVSVWAAGRLAQRFAVQSEQLETALVRLELEREAGERAAVALERSRIAAEMHDVVGNAVGLMVLQTGAARLGLATGDTNPAASAAEERLRAAEETGRRALEDLRRSLGSLRGVPLQTEASTSPR